jgi:hypothetical protein
MTAAAKNVRDAEPGVDMTEVMAAIAKLRGKEPPSGPVIVPASTFPVSSQIKQEDVEATAKRMESAESGDLMLDGTVYLGRFRNKNGLVKDWFAAAEDARDERGNRLSLTFNQAALYAINSKAHGHEDWMVPPAWDDRNGMPGILGALVDSKNTGAFKNTFDETKDSSYPGWYWSSSPFSNSRSYAKSESFISRGGYSAKKKFMLSVRLVRSVTV